MHPHACKVPPPSSESSVFTVHERPHNLFVNMAFRKNLLFPALALAALCAAPASAFMPLSTLPRPALRTGAVNARMVLADPPAAAPAPKAPKAKDDTPEPYVDPKPTLGLSAPFLEGNDQAEDIFAFLQSKTYSKDREGFILGEIFADGIVRNGGFTEFAEKVNGRVAQMAFLPCLGLTFQGDIFTQIADSPLQVLALSGLIAYASLPPQFEAREDDRRGAALFKSAVPPQARDFLYSFYDTLGLKDIFTEEAELTNSRAAMAAFGVWFALATLF